MTFAIGQFLFNSRMGSVAMFAALMFGSVLWWRVDRALHADRAAQTARVETQQKITDQSRVKAKEI
ncbi:MAG: hypothetical protein AAGG72_08915, partial [Pseudomonadota bacterium]